MSTTGEQVMKLTPKIMVSLATIMKELTEALLKLLEAHETDRLIQGVANNIRNNGEIDVQLCKSFAYNDFASKLRANDVPHAVLQDTATGLVVILTNAQDRDRVNDLKNELYTEQRRVSRVTVHELQRLKVSQYLHTIPDVSDAQVALFQAQAKRHNFVMAAEKKGDGKNVLYYAEADAGKAARALSSVSVALCGVTGNITANRLQRETKHLNIMTEAIQDPAKDFYVVSATKRVNGEYAMSEYIHINADGFSHYRKDEYNREQLVRDEGRDNEKFLSSAYNQAMGITRPVILTRQQFESPERDKYIAKLTAEPMITQDQRHQAKIEMQARALIEAKLSLDNGNQPENVSSFYNGEVSFGEFFEHELVNDSHDAEEQQRAGRLQAFANELDAMTPHDQQIARNYIIEIYNTNEHVRDSIERVYNDEIKDLDAKIASMDREDRTYETMPERDDNNYDINAV